MQTHRVPKTKGNGGTARLLVTDLDGTLLRSDGTIAAGDLAALHTLKAGNITLALATGRSLYSFSRSSAIGLPFDYIIFSTGAGVAAHPNGEVLRKVNLPLDAVDRGLAFLSASAFDFMLHAAVPDNHHFFFRRTGHTNPDFEARIDLYRPFARPLDGHSTQDLSPAAQFLVVVAPENAAAALKAIKAGLPGLSVIYATSPLDRRSVWIEIFNPYVSKSRAAAWLADKLGVKRQNTAAIGNDFNDLDLLQWSASSYVVDNAPAALKKGFAGVASNDNGGVAQAVQAWLGRDSLA